MAHISTKKPTYLTNTLGVTYKLFANISKMSSHIRLHNIQDDTSIRKKRMVLRHQGEVLFYFPIETTLNESLSAFYLIK